jgi:hypothetical protein
MKHSSHPMWLVNSMDISLKNGLAGKGWTMINNLVPIFVCCNLIIISVFLIILWIILFN